MLGHSTDIRAPGTPRQRHQLRRLSTDIRGQEKQTSTAVLSPLSPPFKLEVKAQRLFPHSGALIINNISLILVVTAQLWVWAGCSDCFLQFEMALKRQDGQFNIHIKAEKTKSFFKIHFICLRPSDYVFSVWCLQINVKRACKIRIFVLYWHLVVKSAPRSDMSKSWAIFWMDFSAEKAVFSAVRKIIGNKIVCSLTGCNSDWGGRSVITKWGFVGFTFSLGEYLNKSQNSSSSTTSSSCFAFAVGGLLCLGAAETPVLPLKQLCD